MEEDRLFKVLFVAGIVIGFFYFGAEFGYFPRWVEHAVVLILPISFLVFVALVAISWVVYGLTKLRRSTRAFAIALLICVGLGLTFRVDSYYKNRYRNPTWVAENFAKSYLTEEPDRMRRWSDKDIHSRIDDLRYVSVDRPYLWKRDKLQLLAWSRLEDTIVATYGYRDYPFLFEEPSDIPLYTLVLQPRDKPSLWERFKDVFSRYGSLHETRWLVVDFFSDSHLLEYLKQVEGYEEEYYLSLSSLSDEDRELRWKAKVGVWEKSAEFQNEWGASQKIEQHAGWRTV